MNCLIKTVVVPMFVLGSAFAQTETTTKVFRADAYGTSAFVGSKVVLERPRRFR